MRAPGFALIKPHQVEWASRAQHTSVSNTEVPARTPLHEKYVAHSSSGSFSAAPDCHGATAHTYARACHSQQRIHHLCAPNSVVAAHCALQKQPRHSPHCTIHLHGAARRIVVHASEVDREPVVLHHHHARIPLLHGRRLGVLLVLAQIISNETRNAKIGVIPYWICFIVFVSSNSLPPTHYEAGELNEN